MWGAKQESRYVNWVATQRNKPYEKFGTWFRDAMLCKNGYIKAWWDTKSDIVIENYKGLTDDQLAMIQQDEEVKLTALTSYPAYGMPPPRRKARPLALPVSRGCRPSKGCLRPSSPCSTMSRSSG
jgi:hypothetical protein